MHENQALVSGVVIHRQKSTAAAATFLLRRQEKGQKRLVFNERQPEAPISNNRECKKLTDDDNDESISTVEYENQVDIHRQKSTAAARCNMSTPRKRTKEKQLVFNERHPEAPISNNRECKKLTNHDNDESISTVEYENHFDGMLLNFL